MTAPNPNAPQEWLCAACNLPLQPKQIRVSYLGSAYPVDLLTCPKCGQIFVPEELAIGKMVEVEQALEDK
jgi:hypothetical protein